MANRDTYQLLEFQPRTCLLPGGKDTNSPLPPASSTGSNIPETLPRQESAIPARPDVRTVIESGPATESASMYPDRRAVHDYRNPGYEMDSFKQPLMPSPVYVLMPTQTAPMDYYPGRGAEAGYGRPYNMDMMARRPRPYRRDDMYIEHSYRRSRKGCCSCWRCAIACIILLAILGVGAAIAGIVFIKLIDDNVVGSSVGNFRNATSTVMPPSSFDIEMNSSESPPVVSNMTIVRDADDSFDIIAIDLTTVSSVMETSELSSSTVIIDASGGTVLATNSSFPVKNTTDVAVPVQFDIGNSPSRPVVVNINVHLPNTTENASIDVLPISGHPLTDTVTESSLDVASTVRTIDSATTLVGTVHFSGNTVSHVAEEPTSSTSASVILLSEGPIEVPTTMASTHDRTMPATPASGMGFSVNGMLVETSPMPAITHMDATQNALTALDNAEKFGMKFTKSQVAGISQLDHLGQTTAEPLVKVDIATPLVVVPAGEATANSPSPSVSPNVDTVGETNTTSITTTETYIGAKIFHRKLT